ncbi:MAG TPA: SGNH/GDSL hydrolase family protein [Blastocatellia bacterium]|nr:SGNH/GDSL hydrolase family protein [Blastocatellia bacterium]
MKPTRVLAVSLAATIVLFGLLASAQTQEERTSIETDQVGGLTEHFGGGSRNWVGTWGSAPQALGANSLSNVTLRQIVHLSLGGRMVRIRLDNTYGDQPLTFSNVRVALQDNGAAVQAETDRAVTFGGAASVTVAQGGISISDPVALEVPNQGNLVVSMFLPGTIGQLTGHTSANQVSYLSTSGDHAGEPGGASFSTPFFDWYWLNGVDVLSSSTSGAIVAFGDSITNGSNSAFGQNHRWPDILADRLLAARGLQRRSVINKGIGGAQLLTYRGDCCPTAAAGLARLDRDVIAQAGVTHVIVLLGVNDIGFSRDATSLIAGFRQLIAQLHAKGLVVVGGTVIPFAGSIVDSPDREATRQTLNQWIRTGREFDGVADFDQAVRDPANPARLLPAFDSGDHLHPGDAGHVAMGNVVRLSLFR